MLEGRVIRRFDGESKLDAAARVYKDLMVGNVSWNGWKKMLLLQNQSEGVAPMGLFATNYEAREFNKKVAELKGLDVIVIDAEDTRVNTSAGWRWYTMN